MLPKYMSFNQRKSFNCLSFLYEIKGLEFINTLHKTLHYQKSHLFNNPYHNMLKRKDWSPES
jgi:hypothetical protein